MATAYDLDPGRSQVWVEGSSSVHPIRATATGLTGWVELDLDAGDLAGRVEIDVERLRSGNAVVDRETRRRIDARRHPTIVGDVTGVHDVTGTTLTLRGTIAFRGETCPVEGAVDVTTSSGALTIEGEQSFDVRHWGLEPPSLLVIKVHPTVRVRIRLEGVGRAGT